MLQLLQQLGDGRTTLVDVPAPGPRPGAVVVRTTRSLISAGTERMLVEFGKAGWLGKARQQPEKVRAVINKVRTNGLFETVRAVRAKLGQPIPLGYCQVGVVADTRVANAEGRWQMADDSSVFRIGDRVVTNAPHAEVVSVGQNLCARIPDAVGDDAATFTPLAAIALQGISLLDPMPGDFVAVTGLGLIGQLSVRILRARGCEVMGFDPSEERRALAALHGAKTAVSGVDPATSALSWTQGKGVAGVLITASAASHEIVSQAARSCRHRGKVVLVGVVGLNLNRADFYRNEVSFQVSCSYGRRDHVGEGSVRANFKQVLDWMAAGRLPVDDLITHRFKFEEAPKAYEALGDRSALGILLQYVAGDRGSEGKRAGGPNGLMGRTVMIREVQPASGLSPQISALTPSVAVIGAGNFAMRTLLPAMAALNAPPRLLAVASHQGAAALLAAQKFRADRATTDTKSVLDDLEINAVFITTRHNDHARQTIAALKASKHVWVEKPLCLTLEELRELESALQSSAVRSPPSGIHPQVSGFTSQVSDLSPPPSAVRRPVLMIGFNRRFAPMAVALRQALAMRPGQHRFTVTVNAGRLDPDHWTLDPRVGGGRIVGEACHFVDLLRYLAGQPIADVRCVRRDTDGQDGGAFELSFAGGTSGLIDYRTDLAAHLPKEMIEVSGGGCSAQIHNWSRLTSSGLGVSLGGFWSRAPRKGHPEAIHAFLAGVRGEPEAMPWAEIHEVSRWSIAMQGMRFPS